MRVAVFLFFLFISIFASQKRVLNSDMTLQYKILPKEAKTLQEFFTNGKIYGRFRVNSFIWDWDREYPNKTKDNWGIGVGGSLEYKTAYYKGFGITSAFYTSQNPWHMDAKDIKYIKAAKDTFCRYSVKKDNKFAMSVLAQAYLEYKQDRMSIKVGRQIFESMLVKSNDTKMIPNSFEGFSLVGIYFDTTLKFAYFTRQKLRDHIKFHDVITYKDENGQIWANNDDGGVNRALSYQNFVAAGKNPKNRLFIIEIINKRYKNLKWIANYTSVPKMVALASFEAHYKIDIENWDLISGFRYIKQMDVGAKDLGRLGVGVANLKANTAGYNDPYKIDSFLFAARIDLRSKNKIWWVRVGYSKVADKADIIAPWRGFPTGGFTRAMAQYNWYANTKTYMIRGVYDFAKAGLVSGLSASIRYAIQDFDDKKSGVQADSNVIHIDLVKKFASISDLYAKVRFGFVNGDDDTKDINGDLKPDPSYKEYRFEINYLF